MGTALPPDGFAAGCEALHCRLWSVDLKVRCQWDSRKLPNRFAAGCEALHCRLWSVD